MHKGMFLVGLLLVGVMVAIPALLVHHTASPTLVEQGTQSKGGMKKSSLEKNDVLNEPSVTVYLSHEKRRITLPLERYIRGVVAAEMPADFHVEALKAQALAARTYIANRLSKNSFPDMKQWGTKAKGAQVTDTVQHQAFVTDTVLREKWGAKYDALSKRVNEAVASTGGEVIQYNGKPIYAAFFSTSNGYTENSEDYFTEKMPYLRSVASPWDRQSPKYETKKTFSLAELTQRIQKSTGKQIAMATSTGNGIMQVKDRTPGNRIGQLRIGDQLFTGRQVREALGLSSSDFSWKVKGKDITFTTKGYGHGVGMSQWGANLMAQQGKSVQSIIKHYYQGVAIAKGNWK
ncbi:stage II sporulation protein D [Marininema halotolerans]|uniref:Stage II sporulation protein D n=1 Tax=Marininema halotolerans TaxID=1155944 RepID=A0A1I6P1R2_9BACL|nr:stage II sporulation protein D [Marininema halotolerans]SFS34144.1 stage II sporulation protein D [Marininema halotolerans]